MSIAGCITEECDMKVRFNTDDVEVHLAGAGAGKSHAAMQEMQESLRTYRPDEIAFVTYTKKGVENGISRALKVNPQLTPDDLMHFKTLHALCFREAHLTGSNIMTGRDIAAFNEAFGFNLSMSEVFGNASEDDRLLQRYDAERSGSRRGVFVDGNFDRMRYDRLVNAYESFKQAHGLVDFHDCLLRYMTDGEPLHGVRLALIDECFAPDTPVRMADGSVRAIKDIRVGDYVMGTSGAVRVLEKHVGVAQMYEVSRSDTDSTAGADTMLFRCNSMHLIEDSMHRWNACSAYFWACDRYGKPMVYMADEERYCPVEIRRIDEGCYVGIAVDSFDHLFLLANGCVVHNCQDLTPLQWEVCMKAFSAAERIRLYGDDFQCLYTYNGAAPELLIEMASHYRLVRHETSYRLPRKVYEFARGITDVIQDKVPKDYAPAEDREGFVTDLPDRNVLARLIRDDLRHHGAKGGRWMLLFRTNCFIEDMTKTLQQFMVPYHTAKGFCISARDLAKIERYQRYSSEGYGTPEAREKFMREYKITDFRDGFAASELIPGVERYYYQDLVDTWGLPMLREMSKMDDPFLLLSTVHRVKGGEADYAALFMDCTRLVHENMTLNADEELRVLYVGCTRCREGLYLIPSKSRYSLSRLVDIVREVNDL